MNGGFEKLRRILCDQHLSITARAHQPIDLHQLHTQSRQRTTLCCIVKQALYVRHNSQYGFQTTCLANCTISLPFHLRTRRHGVFIAPDQFFLSLWHLCRDLTTVNLKFKTYNIIDTRNLPSSIYLSKSYQSKLSPVSSYNRTQCPRTRNDDLHHRPPCPSNVTPHYTILPII